MNEGALKYRIKRRISEKATELTALLGKPGKHLIISPTDTGKTYGLLNQIDGIFRILSKLYPNRNFIIACPNRVQNEQNQKSYGVYALIGGATIDITKAISSMVYEKSEEAVKEYLGSEKELTLVIDEGHQLMYAENYRKEGIQFLEKLSETAYNTVHITATARTLKDHYKYDSILEFQLEEPKNANNLEKLFVIPTGDMETSLVHQIKAIHNTGKQVLVLIDSKDSIEMYSELLKGSGLNVGIVKADNKKDNEVYESIINNSIIPSTYDATLSTSALECGTNLLNENIVMIIVVPRSDRFNVDKIEQGFARLRVKNEYGILLIRNYEQKEDIIIEDKEIIKKKLRFEVDRAVRKAEELIDLLKRQGETLEEVVNLARGHLNLNKCDGSKVGMGLVDITDNGEVIVNEKAFVVRVHQMYDAQYLNNKDKLVEYLHGPVKADKIIFSDTYVREDAQDKKDLQDIKSKNAETKENLDVKAREIILGYGSDILFEQFITCKEALDVVGISDENNEKFRALEVQKKQLKIISDMVNKDNIPFKVAVEIYASGEKASEIKNKSKEYLYIQTNRAVPLGRLNIDLHYEYGLIRRVVDDICMRQGRITDAVIEELVEDLMVHKEFTKYKAWEKYKNAKNEKEKEKRFEPIKNDIIGRISLIYNLSISESYIRVSSLKKNFKC